MSATKLNRLRKRAVIAQQTAQDIHAWAAPLLDLKSRPRSYKLDDQRYRAESYEFARKAAEDYQRATLHLAAT